MKDWFKKLAEQAKALWAKWTLTQKLILGGIVLAAIIAIIVIGRVSAAPTMIKVISTPIKTEDELRAITSRLDTEGIAYQVGDNNTILVRDEKTATKAKAVLISNDLIPKGTDPWTIFDMEKWTITDFERNVNLQRAITQQVTNHIEALDDVDKANVTLVIPQKELFSEDQKPVTASVIVFPKVGSDLTENRHKIEGIQKILKFAVAGLTDDNIVITDNNGVILNDFSSMAEFDRLEQTKKEQKLIQELEAKYRARVLEALQQTYGTDRVRDLSIKIDMDMSKKSIKAEEFYPITIKADNPNTPYDDSEVVPSVTRSKTTSTTTYEGTGYNPEGPAGAEGQTAPAYKDLQNMVGKMQQSTVTQNEEINKRDIEQVVSPSIQRVTVSVNIDGTWSWKYDKNGKVVLKPQGGIERDYKPVPDTELAEVASLVQGAVGYDKARGDTVTVKNIPYNHDSEFKKEDDAYMRQRQINDLILYLLIAVAVLLTGFILYKVISREHERRRRIQEEKRALEQQMIRENAIRQAQDQTVEVSMSVEERKRLELQEHAINMAKEHPEDVAQLIRTWMREE